MKAVLMTAAGEPEVLQLKEVPDPQIQKDKEILVRLKAAGVNPIDTKLRQRGTFYPEQMPAILGCDGAGVVEAVGSGVQRFRVGDEVYFCRGGLSNNAGHYAQLAVVDERFVARKPASLNFTEAAAAPLVLITAWEALDDRGRLEVGERVLIHAGAGGVGHVAIGLAKLKGANVCTTISSKETDFVYQLGADYAISYKEIDFMQAALNWTQGEGVDLAFDTVGGEIFYKTFSCVRIYGDIVTILEPDPAHSNWQTARNRNLRISYELMLTPMLQGLVAAQQHQAEILEQSATWIDQGKLKIHVSKVFPIEEAAAAHRQLEAGSTVGEIVLVTDT